LIDQRASLHGQWSSRAAFILAVTGSAVGLGNIWRFPYLAGENGGGAFVLVYIACVAVVGLPIMMAEILLGRRGRRNPIATMQLLGEEEAGTSGWRWVAIIGVATGFLILSFYSVIAGWAVAYIFQGGSGVFVGADREAISAIFHGLLSDPLMTTLWHSVFMGMAVFVVALGVEQGLDRAFRILMSGLVLLLLFLLGYEIYVGDFMDGFQFLLEPRLEDLTAEGVLAALGQAFFTLSVGTGAVMAYGAYLPSSESIAASAIWVVIADTVISILAGLVVFSIAFANGVDPAVGRGLVFESLPLAFGQMDGGTLIAMIFFVLVTFAAWTSAISLMEPAVVFLVEQFEFRRAPAAILVGFAAWAFGLLTVLSFGPWSEFRLAGWNLFDWIDFAANEVLLPLAGFAIVIFAGWFMAENSTADELDPEAGLLYRAWRFAARFVAPVAILFVFLYGMGLFESSNSLPLD